MIVNYFSKIKLTLILFSVYSKMHYKSVNIHPLYQSINIQVTSITKIQDNK